MIKLFNIMSEIKIVGNIPYKYCWINDHDDYHTLNIATEKSYREYLDQLKQDAIENDWEFNENYEPEYLEEIPSAKIVFIDWNDEGPNTFDFDNMYEFIKDASSGYWDGSQFYEYLGDGNEELGEQIYNEFYTEHNEETMYKILEKLKQWIDNSEADGDSASACMLIINNKIVASGPYRII